MTLGLLAKSKPDALVLLSFKNDQGTGSLVTTAAHAVAPNQSGRFFPPGDLTPADLGWPQPYWFGSEVVAWKPYEVPR